MIAVAMSGGVDSSTAAALLKNQGHELVGFSMQLWNQRRINVGPDGEPLPSRCCSLDDLYDARVVAHKLGFPFYVVNLEDEFERDVVRPFVTKYLDGLTPSPCVACNSFLKFDKLVELVPWQAQARHDKISLRNIDAGYTSDDQRRHEESAATFEPRVVKGSPL